MKARAAVVVLLIGAASASADLRAQGAYAPVIETEQEQYEAGEVAALRLHNPLDEPVGFNACTWTLERRGDEGWKAAPFEDARICTMELEMLAPGESATPEFGLDDRLPAGKYRFRAVLHTRATGSRTVRLSEPFHVER